MPLKLNHSKMIGMKLVELARTDLGIKREKSCDFTENLIVSSKVSPRTCGKRLPSGLSRAQGNQT